MSRMSIPPLNRTRNAHNVAASRRTTPSPMSRSSATRSVRKPARFSTAGSADAPLRNTVNSAIPAHPIPIRIRFAPVMFATARSPASIPRWVPAYAPAFHA